MDPFTDPCEGEFLSGRVFACKSSVASRRAGFPAAPLTRDPALAQMFLSFTDQPCISTMCFQCRFAMCRICSFKFLRPGMFTWW